MKGKNEQELLMNDPKDYIRAEVHRLYYTYDTNCARVTMHCLGHLFNIEIEEQTWWAAAGMHGAGGFGAQCGLVEGALLFIGIFCHHYGLPRQVVVDACFRYGEAFAERFGSLRCCELRPGGFKEDDPPHLCERLSCDTTAFAYEFMKEIQKKYL